MNVGIVAQNEYPHVGLVRPRKLGRSLHRLGHRVAFLSWNSGTQPRSEVLDDGVVHRFPYFLGSRLYHAVSPASPLNPLWAYWVWRMARHERLDVLIGSNIRVALPAIVAARLAGIPFVLDLEENNREAVKLYPRTRWTDHIKRNSRLVGLLEHLCVALADHTWVVVEERMTGLPQSARRANRISVVCHTPSLDELVEGSPGDRHRAFTLAYVGLFAPGVGSLESILRALPLVIRREPDVRLLIAGGRQLEPMVRQLGIEHHVSFAGMVPPDQVTTWVRQADVGIIAYEPNPFTNTTVSNKLFHYMAAGIAVLSTDMPPTRRIIDEARCGRVLPRGCSSEQIAEILLDMKHSRAELVAMGERGRQAIVDTYHWERDFGHALACLETLVGSKGHLAATHA
jgi:glycosyltransferase involved in cell wall biosynthesis